MPGRYESGIGTCVIMDNVDTGDLPEGVNIDVIIGDASAILGNKVVSVAETSAVFQIFFMASLAVFFRIIFVIESCIWSSYMSSRIPNRAL